MAAVIPSLALGTGGTVTSTTAGGGIGLIDTNDFVIKSAAFILQFSNQTEDTSGYGDGGWRTYNATTIGGQFTVAGWLQDSTSCRFDPQHLGEEYIETVFTCDAGVTYTGTIVIETMRIDHRYSRNIPVQMSGKFTRTADDSTVVAVPISV